MWSRELMQNCKTDVKRRNCSIWTETSSLVKVIFLDDGYSIGSTFGDTVNLVQQLLSLEMAKTFWVRTFECFSLCLEHTTYIWNVHTGAGQPAYFFCNTGHQNYHIYKTVRLDKTSFIIFRGKISNIYKEREAKWVRTLILYQKRQKTNPTYVST